jgi:hypothetical protein
MLPPFLSYQEHFLFIHKDVCVIAYLQIDSCVIKVVFIIPKTIMAKVVAWLYGHETLKDFETELAASEGLSSWICSET